MSKTNESLEKIDRSALTPAGQVLYDLVLNKVLDLAEVKLGIATPPSTLEVFVNPETKNVIILTEEPLEKV